MDKPHYTGHRQRQRDKVLTGDAEKLADYELIELILFYSIPMRDVKPLAKELLNRMGNFSAVLHLEHSFIKHKSAPIKLSDRTLALFSIIKESARRMALSRVLDKPLLANWDAVVEYCRVAIAHERIEQLRILFLDSKYRLICDELHDRGTINYINVYPREILKRAITLGASAIILVHNHPSGDVLPSRNDIKVTRKIREDLKKLGMVLQDHIIISQSGYTSLKNKMII